MSVSNPPAGAALRAKEQKARKLFEALAEDCEQPKHAGDDHAWRRCRRCLAVAQLEERGARELLRALLAHLHALTADLARSDQVRALIEKWVEQTCTMNCDAESSCVCRSHQHYRKVLAAITGAPQP